MADPVAGLKTEPRRPEVVAMGLPSIQCETDFKAKDSVVLLEDRPFVLLRRVVLNPVHRLRGQAIECFDG